MTTSIRFRAKVRAMYAHDGDSVAYEYLQVPKLARSHCDMSAMRTHPKYGGLANSDLFHGVLARIRDGMCSSSGTLRLDALPDHVSVDRSGYLAVVTISV